VLWVLKNKKKRENVKKEFENTTNASFKEKHFRLCGPEDVDKIM